MRVDVPGGGVGRPTGARSQHLGGTDRPLAGTNRTADQSDLRNKRVCRTLLHCHMATGWLGLSQVGDAGGASAAEVGLYDAPSDKRAGVVPREKLVLPGGSQPLERLWFQRAPSGKRFLLHGEVTQGKRRSGHWLYQPELGALRPLDEGPGLWFDANAFSPDG